MLRWQCSKRLRRGQCERKRKRAKKWQWRHGCHRRDGDGDGDGDDDVAASTTKWQNMNKNFARCAADKLKLMTILL